MPQARLCGRHFSTGRCYLGVTDRYKSDSLVPGGLAGGGQPVQTGGSRPVLMEVFLAVVFVLVRLKST